MCQTSNKKSTYIHRRYTQTQTYRPLFNVKTFLCYKTIQATFDRFFRAVICNSKLRSTIEQLK